MKKPISRFFGRLRDVGLSEAIFWLAPVLVIGLLIRADSPRSVFDGLANRPSSLTGSSKHPPGSYRPGPLAPGKQTYYVSSKDVPGPTPSEFSVEPFDAKRGGRQIWSVSVKNPQPVLKGYVKVNLDNGSYALPLNKVAGTETDGVWLGSWELPDTNDYVYDAVIVFEDADSTGQVFPTFR